MDSLRTWAGRVWLPAFYELYIRDGNGTRLILGDNGTPTAYLGKPRLTRTKVRDKHGRVVYEGDRPKLREKVEREQIRVNPAAAVKAQECLTVLVRALEGCPVFVPQVISEQAGYSSPDAKAYHRRSRVAA